MADAEGGGPGIYFAVILVILALGGLVYFSRDVARESKGVFKQLEKIHKENSTARNLPGAPEATKDGSMPLPVAPGANWVSYADQAWGYQLRFPKTHRARLIDSNELTSPLPGELLLTGIVLAPAPDVATERTPNYTRESLTLLLTDWPSFGNSQNFLNEAYVSGTVPKEQIEAFILNGRAALRLRITSDRGGVSTTHTEIIVAGPGSKVLKIIYWPSDNQTLAAIASTIKIQ